MPSDPGQVLVDWLRGRFGTDVELEGPSESSGSGFDSEIHFVSVAGSDVPEGWRGPLVLRIKPDVDRFDIAVREMAIQNYGSARRPSRPGSPNRSRRVPPRR